jgi:hypothetical protein
MPSSNTMLAHEPSQVRENWQARPAARFKFRADIFNLLIRSILAIRSLASIVRAAQPLSTPHLTMAESVGRTSLNCLAAHPKKTQQVQKGSGQSPHFSCDQPIPISVPSWIATHHGKSRARNNQIGRTFPRIGCESLGAIGCELGHCIA